MEFDYTLEPGRELNIKKFEDTNIKPVVSVIMPFYNDKDYIRQSVTAILNQTFPLFEFLIIDDGSKDEESLKVLDEVSKWDSRIKVFHKENEGLAATRDFGASKSDDNAKYLFFLDSDDLIEPTYLECAYWTLETNKDASWAYSDCIGFDASQYTWNKWFDSRKMKKINDLVATALIRKEDFFEVNGYELREKAVNEDWNFWLKMIAKKKFPVRMNFYGFWYRRKNSGSELAKSRNNKKRALEIIKNTAKTIKKRVKAIQYPRYKYNWDLIDEINQDIVSVKRANNNKINILMFVPWMTTGGADKFNIDFLKGLDKEKFEVTVITTEPQVNNYRQNFEKYSTVYDLTTFIDKKYWLSFINYIVNKNNINFIFNTNSGYGYSILPYLKAKYPETPIIDYVHMEEWYNRNGGYSRDSAAVKDVIDKTYVCNENSRKILIDHFKKDENEVKTVYIGVDEKEFNPENYSQKDKETILEKYKINKNNRYIISYICRIAAQKRPILLAKVIKETCQKRKDCLFVIAGDGDMLNKLKSKVKKYGVSDSVVFLGNVSNTKEIYAISDLTINCSIKEGLALTSYESLAMGVPVISSDVGGQKELINEEVGVIVPCMQKEEDIKILKYKDEEIDNYAKAIDKVIENINNYKSKCRERVLNGFTLDNMQNTMQHEIIEIYNNPNKSKIENGKGLSKNISVAKELNTMFLQENATIYKWQCEQYNTKIFGDPNGTDGSRIKAFGEKHWGNPLYRGFFKFCKAIGIVALIKKLRK